MMQGQSNDMINIYFIFRFLKSTQIGRAYTNWGNNPDFYPAVALSFKTWTKYGLAHEIGHVLGLRHDHSDKNYTGKTLMYHKDENYTDNFLLNEYQCDKMRKESNLLSSPQKMGKGVAHSMSNPSVMKVKPGIRRRCDKNGCATDARVVSNNHSKGRNKYLGIK
jgi:hypothetical protein